MLRVPREHRTGEHVRIAVAAHALTAADLPPQRGRKDPRSTPRSLASARRKRRRIGKVRLRCLQRIQNACRIALRIPARRHLRRRAQSIDVGKASLRTCMAWRPSPVRLPVAALCGDAQAGSEFRAGRACANCRRAPKDAMGGQDGRYGSAGTPRPVRLGRVITCFTSRARSRDAAATCRQMTFHLVGAMPDFRS